MKQTFFLIFIFASIYCKSQTIITIAGNGTSGFSGDGDTATKAQLTNPADIAIDSNDNVYIADNSNFRIRKVSNDKKINTYAGNGYMGYGGDGNFAWNASFYRPCDVKLDDSGHVYIVDYDFNIRRTGMYDIISTLNTYIPPYFYSIHPEKIAIDDSGNKYVIDRSNQIYKIFPSDSVKLFAGTGLYGYSGDGGPALAAEFYNPNGIAVDKAGNVYVADAYNYRIRKISKSGIVTTVAGNGTYSGAADTGLATSVGLGYIMNLTVDWKGNIYMCDNSASRVRKVDASTGKITTVVGNGTYGFAGDGGNPKLAETSGGNALAVDLSGNLYIAESNFTVRFTNLCGINHILTSPRDTIILPGTHSYFSIKDDKTKGGTFQWQVDTGSGFNNIISGGVYSGANSARLDINSSTAKMNNYKYRCVRGTKYCADTSVAATLSVWKLGIEELRQNFSINPNPANNIIVIDAAQKIDNVEIINSLGQLILTEHFNSEKSSLNISQLLPGNYFIRINNQYTQKFIKE